MPDHIQKLIAEGEHQMLDFKFEVSDCKKIARSLAAFANTDGGRLLIGVKDNGAISGIRTEEEKHMIQTAAKMYCKPEVKFKANEWVINGKKVLEIIIPKSSHFKHKAPDHNNIYKVYNIGENAEITIECNPDDVDENFASFLKTMGINRVSMGAQTFSDNRLQFINRRHTAADVAKAVCSLRKSGIDNISVDLIFGFPCETIDEWEHDINEALALDVNHISAYSLTIEDDTPLGRMVENGDITEINEELSRSMYMLLLEKMADAGYEHYEISNFAKPYYRSRHNSGYWQQKPYIGLGAAAHSYDSLSRQWNVADLMSYINGVESGNMAFEREILDSQTMYNDIITTTMRTCEGVSMAEIESAFGVNYLDEMMRSAKKHIASGLLEIKDKRLRLTSKGLFLSDLVMRDLIIV